MVQNNIRRRGPVIFADMTPGEALRKALAMTPAEVIRDLNTARLRALPMSPICGEIKMRLCQARATVFFICPPVAKRGCGRRKGKVNSSGELPRPSRRGRNRPKIGR